MDRRFTDSDDVRRAVTGLEVVLARPEFPSLPFTTCSSRISCPIDCWPCVMVTRPAGRHSMANLANRLGLLAYGPSPSQKRSGEGPTARTVTVGNRVAIRGDRTVK